MQSQRILVIDDDFDIRQSLAEVLESENHTVLQASDGLEALEKLKDDLLPNLILLDLTMPRMNGWQFMDKCQKDPRCKKVPIVVISAVATKEAAQGAVDFIRKPVDINILLDKVRIRSHQPTFQ